MFPSRGFSESSHRSLPSRNEERGQTIHSDDKLPDFLSSLVCLDRIIGEKSDKCKSYASSQRETIRRIFDHVLAQSQHDVNFNSLWSTENPSFRRPGGVPSGNFYYQAVLITVPTTGIYTITSQSLVDTFGCLYSPSFDRRSPNQDLIVSDDDSGGNGQFRLNRNLAVNRRYYLVVTTYSPSVTGTFTVTISGPKAVDVIPITGR